MIDDRQLDSQQVGASIPSDALGLIEWAHQMIDDRQLDSQQVGASIPSDALG